LTQKQILPGTYPDSWDEYEGQEAIKQRLRVAAASARMRGARMPNFLLEGAPGIGKTALAFLAAQELGTNISIASGRIRVTEIRMALARMGEGDILVLEEVHQIAKASGGEWLVHFLENRSLVGPWGREDHDGKQISIIATTTDPGAFGEDILQRFTRLPLQRYTADEAGLIALRFGQQLLHPHGLPDLDVAPEVALAARNHPRTMRELIVAMRDLVLAGVVSTYPDALAQALDWAGTTHDGLTKVQVRYLTLLAGEFNGAPTGGDLLSQRLGLTGKNRNAQLEEIEAYLMELGLVTRLDRGRMLTGAGVARAMEFDEERLAG
jgi:holliday junction DNA helicase RuvB